MRISLSKTFYEGFDALSREKQVKVKKALEAMRDFYVSGIRTEGLGLKKLRKNYWEIRAGLDTRIIFILEGNELTFVVTGSHDEIRRFIRNI